MEDLHEKRYSRKLNAWPPNSQASINHSGGSKNPTKMTAIISHFMASSHPKTCHWTQKDEAEELQSHDHTTITNCNQENQAHN